MGKFLFKAAMTLLGTMIFIQGFYVALGYYIGTAEIEEVVAQVVDKVHEEQNTEEEKYIVQVKYKNMEASVDNQRLYEDIEVGDRIKVNYVKKFKKYTVLEDEYIDLSILSKMY